jgi:alanine racemase
VATTLSDYSGALSILEIHLDRISRNYLALQKMLARGCDCAAVVKADAYGLGAAKIAPVLYDDNCRHFFVSQPEEAFDVHAALSGKSPEAHIYLLHGPRGIEAKDLAAKNITPVLNTLEDIAHWSSYAKAAQKKLPAVLHIDTGMNRLGLSATDIQKLGNALEPLDIRYVMSHLACADTPDRPENQHQLEKFKKYAAQLGLPCRLSFANSSGIYLGADYHFDQVRPGSALYGINPQPGHANPMQNPITLKARILQTREAAAGETVGYGATYKVSKSAKLATISVGYADGYLRHLSNQGKVYINGQKCPVVGRVSMDAIVADVTALPRVQTGDWAEIVGEHQTADDVAAQAGTIGYEILTALGQRYKRIYSGR